MAVKDEVLASLEASKGAFISGGELAARLNVSRNSVWKAIKALQEAGYAIESVTGKGYRLQQDCSILSAASIKRFLTCEDVAVEFHSSIGSTNDRAKELARSGAPEGTLVVADEQTAGRGRQGRPFFSPAGTGVYFTLVLRPSFPLSCVQLITSYTALCCARAMDEVFGTTTRIKWVNDIFTNGHKCCGILTEAAVQPESGAIDYVVVGIGINVAEPKDGFPAEFSGVAQALRPANADGEDARARLVARIVDLMMSQRDDIPNKPHLEEYRRRSLLDGRTVQVYEGRQEYTATVIGIDDDFKLLVELADGTQKALVAGEVHIPSSQLN